MDIRERFRFGDSERVNGLLQRLSRNEILERAKAERGGITPPEFSSSGETYHQRMNLDDEIREMLTDSPSGITMWDVGAGSGDATCELQDFYKEKDVRFLAINPHILPHRSNQSLTAPFVKGSFEELATVVVADAKKIGLYPPDILIFSNSLQYSFFGQTFDMALLNINELLQGKTRAVIYEDAGEFLYEEYAKAIKVLGLEFHIEEVKNKGGFCPTYLRISKGN